MEIKIIDGEEWLKIHPEITMEEILWFSKERPTIDENTGVLANAYTPFLDMQVNCFRTELDEKHLEILKLRKKLNAIADVLEDEQ